MWIGGGTHGRVPTKTDAEHAIHVAKRRDNPSAMSLYEALQLLAMVAVPVVAGGLGLIVYRIRSIATSIDNADSRLDQHGERLAKIEATIGQVSELRNDVKDVHKRVDEVLGKVGDVDSKVSVVEGQFAELTRTNKLIQEHLMAKAHQ